MYGNKAKLAHSSVDFGNHRYTNVKTIVSLLYESVIPKEFAQIFLTPQSQNRSYGLALIVYFPLLNQTSR